ncbi:MAG TPA: ATP-binding protein [Gemmatimonadales bacterium]|nr:ATP-binding protein [Gemmatimonadales bacterium]
MTPEEFGNRLRIAHDRVASLTQHEDVDSERAAEELRSAVEELRVADEELRAQNEELVTAHLEVEAERLRYHELFDLAPDAYLVTNLAGIIDEANLSASRLLGIAREFLIGKALAAYITTDDRVRFRSLLSSRDRGGISRPLPFRVRARGGTSLHVELTYSIIDDERRNPAGFRWIVRDVTEQERMARQIRSLNTELESRVAERTGALQAAQELSEELLRREQSARRAAKASEAQSRHVQKLESIGVLAGGIAHDFNNLLHVILGNADIALSRLAGRSPAREPLEEVIRATIRAADLTRQMLAYSGKGAFVVRNLDLSNEVREMATLLRTAISKQATLVWELETGLPPVKADATQIRQIVMNLITNASDALQNAGGTITLRTGVLDRSQLDDPAFGTPVGEVEPAAARSEEMVYLEVHDTGAGMTPDTLRRIFDPFFSTKFSGRGLGLAAVMGIVRSHQGLIRIRTEPERGTSFQVLLPSVAGKVTKQEKPSAARSEWRGEGTILVVEDEAEVREVAERILQDFGFQTVPAGDGRDALDLMESRGSEIMAILLDLSMPRMGGQEALRQLRESWPDLPVIMMSGYTEESVAAQFSDADPGVTAFLQKPFFAEDLIGVLRRVLVTVGLN